MLNKSQSMFVQFFRNFIRESKRTSEEPEMFFDFAVIMMSVRFGSVRSVEY